MSNALNRDPQSVNLKTALKMYTINGAYVMRQEDRTGSLEVGKDADLIIIDRFQIIFAWPLFWYDQEAFNYTRDHNWLSYKLDCILNSFMTAGKIQTRLQCE